MTSQKSLKNNVYIKDFLRSLLQSLIFPVIALLVLFFLITAPVIGYVSSEEFLTAKFHNEISLFFLPDSLAGYQPELLTVGMVLCGILTAIYLFSFTMSKKKVNVYFSLGISRSRLFINRTVAGVLALFMSVLIPFGITYLVNASSFGMSAHLTTVFLYLLSLFFVSGLAGFAIGTFASSVSGNMFEAALTSGTFSFLPALISWVFYDDFVYRLPNGFIRDAVTDLHLKLLSPFTFGIDYSAKYVEISRSSGVIDTFHYALRWAGAPLESTGEKNWKIPEELSIDFGYILPVILWLVISLVILGAAIALFNRRPAEHANSFGKFRTATAIISASAFFATVYAAFEMLYWAYADISVKSIFRGNAFLTIAVSVLATAIVYFIVQLILKRKIKPVLKSFAWYGVLMGVTVFGFVFAATDFFGAYNKMPKAEDIKSVSMDVDVGSLFSHNINGIMNIQDVDNCKNLIFSENPEDIKMAGELVKKLQKEKSFTVGNELKTVTVVFVTKDGKKCVRRYSIISEELYNEYCRDVFNSDYFDLVLKKTLLDEPPKSEISDNFAETGLPVDYNGIYDYAYGEYDTVFNYKYSSWKYLGSSYIAFIKADDDFEADSNIPDSASLCKALYEDLSKMDYDMLYKNASKPIGALTTDFTNMNSVTNTIEYKNGFDMEYYDSDGNYTYGYEQANINGDKEDKTNMFDSYLYVGTDTVYLYPEMTNTLKYLKDNGIEPYSDNGLKVKEVLCTDGPRDLTDVYTEYFSKITDSTYKTFDYLRSIDFRGTSPTISVDFSGTITEVLGDNFKMTKYECLKKLFATCGHPLISVTDAAKAEKIVNATVPCYNLTGDAGRYVYIIYENDTVVYAYLPAANANVIA